MGHNDCCQTQFDEFPSNQRLWSLSSTRVVSFGFDTRMMPEKSQVLDEQKKASRTSLLYLFFMEIKLL
jgi:hypothetical protein